MARNTEALKVSEAWAGSATGAGNRAAIPSALRSAGWDAEYSRPGGKTGPERTFFNQLLHEISSLAVEVNTGMCFSQWSSAVDYVHDATNFHYSFVLGSDDRIYVSTAASGPGTGDATNPTTDTSRTKWKVY